MNTEAFDDESEQLIKSYPRLTIGELARLYKRDKKTILKWLEPIQEDLGPRIGHTYTTQQMKRIFKYLGAPLLAYLMSTYAAFAGHGKNPDTDATKVGDPASYAPVAIPLLIYLIIKSFMMTTWVVINIESIVHNFRFGTYGPKTREIIVSERLRIASYITYGLVVGVAFVALGYFLGKWMLR